MFRNCCSDPSERDDFEGKKQNILNHMLLISGENIIPLYCPEVGDFIFAKLFYLCRSLPVILLLLTNPQYYQCDLYIGQGWRHQEEEGGLKWKRCGI